MPNTLAEVEQFAATHPHPHQGGTWNQLCEQFINNSGGFSQAFTTAELAAKASGGLDPNPNTARPGEIHYWSDFAGQGHDAWQTSRGLLCASNAIPGYLGYISFAAFAHAKPNFHYMGHTFRHGTQTLDFTSTAGTGTVTPVSDPTSTVKENDTMTDIIYYAHGAASTTPLVGPDGKPYVVQPESMWYQECPGAPLFPLTGNAGYTTTVAGVEFLAFAGTRPAGGGDFQATPDQVAQLLTLRGFASKPTGNFVSGGSGGTTVAGASLADITKSVQIISDASDLKVTAAIGKIPAAPTKFVAAP